MAGTDARRTLDLYLAPSANSFNLIRLVAALAVIVSHSALILYGPGTPQLLADLTPYTLGQHAVNVFFVISGLSLAASLDRRPDLRRYAAGQFLRVFPALFVAGVVVAFLLGPLVTNMGLLAYLEDAHTLFYPALVLVEFQDASPPGLFHELPYGDAIDVPLWTIRYEIAAYCGLAGLFAAGLLRWRMATCVLLAAAAAIHAACAAWSASTDMTPQAAHAIALAGNVSRFGMSFLLGVAAFQFRTRLSLTPLWFGVLIPAAILVSGTPLAPVAAVVFAAYATLYFGTLSYGPLSAWTRRTDISYGAYLYGWPVQQTLLCMMPGIGIAVHTAMSLALAGLAGLLSWRYVEKPLIGLKNPPSAPLPSLDVDAGIPLPAGSLAPGRLIPRRLADRGRRPRPPR